MKAMERWREKKMKETSEVDAVAEVVEG